MKPVKLIISGWGPYKGREEIDFKALSNRGIFLITGQTGAGKTTIFDAITYALYGDLSGSLRGKNSVRSDFADGQTETFVEFTMEHKGACYRIRRNPEYQRPRKKKGTKESLVTEKENACLWDSDGSVLQGNREVTGKIRELLHLDLRQFRQISMIAQGEFAQLLHAGGEEKMKIFREIFGTSVYDLFLKKLKERAQELEKRAAEYLQRMEEDVRLFQTEEERFLKLTEKQPYPYREIAALLKEMEQEAEIKVSGLGAQEAILEEEIRQTTAALALAEGINDRFAQLKKQENRLRALQEQETSMQLLERTCNRARAAWKVYEADRRKKQAQTDLEREQESLQKLQEELNEMVRSQENLRPMAAAEAEIEKLYELLEEEQQAAQKSSQTQKLLGQREEALIQKQRQYLEAEERTQERQRVYEGLLQLQKHAMIGIVAAMVRDGEPCPVCGSFVHPNIACTQQEAPEEAQLEQEKKALEDLQQKMLTCHGEAHAALKLRDSQRKEAAEAEAERKQLQEAVLHMQEQLKDVFMLWKAEKSAGMPERKVFRQQIRLFHDTEISIAEKKENRERIRENMVLFQVRSRELDELVKQEQKEQGFDAEEDWKSAVRSEQEQEQMQKALQTYREDLRAVQELIRHLKEELLGKQETDPEPLQKKQEEQAKRKQKLLADRQKWSVLQETAERTAHSLMANLKKAAEVQADYGVVKDLENMASGNNDKRLVFEQYVLAGYFEDILRAANLRLKYMSGGRYELFRAGKISDGRKKDSLEIEVMDYYTGRRRSVRTLSGGETFKASLALALGLSDAVQAASGGVKIETLFIDEGFGSLDAQSLDQACSALMSLTGENRLIGIISHVPELKERIDAQIAVEKETDGSRIRVLC